MRESLFEKLKKKEISYIKELKKINNLLNQTYTSTYSYFENAFKKSSFNVYFEDFDEAMLSIIETENSFYIDSSYNFDYLINHYLGYNNELTLDSFLDYLEFLKTLLDYNSRDFDTNAKQISLIIQNDCEKIGYTFRKDEETKTYKVMLKNPEAEAVALNVEESTRNKIYRYLMIRYGKIEDKRECIKSLADDVEVICKKYSNIEEYNKLKQFIQCARHTKDVPKKEFPFYYDDEENWLDKTFEMIIGILAFTKTKKIVKEIKELENNK